MVQDKEGHYGNSVHVLLYEGHMLVYDLATNLLEWVPMRDVLSSLTSVELRSANDLSNIFPCPHSGGEPPRTQSPKLVCSQPARGKTDSDSWKSPSDLEEWDESKCSDWSCCPTPPVEEEGLTWEEIMSEPPHRCIPVEQDDPDSDWDVDRDTDAPAEECSEGASEQSLPKKEQPEETLMETLMETQHDETLAEAAIGPASQDMIQLHVGDDDIE